MRPTAFIILMPSVLLPLAPLWAQEDLPTIGAVGVYASNPPGSVNTFWIETGEGLVIVDAQRVAHEARLAIERIEALGRPVLAVLITHPHPDHFGGLPAFREAFGEDLDVYATAAAAREIEADTAGFIAATEASYGPDFAEDVVVPNRAFADGDALAFGELTFEVHGYGPGEGADMSVVFVPEAGALFVGDVAANARTSFLVEGRTEAWLDQLAVARSAFPEDAAVYPGHGEPGTMAILDDEAAYIRAVREAVAAAGSGEGALTDADIEAIAAELSERYPPDYQGRPPVSNIEGLVRLNGEAVAREVGRLPPE